MKRLKKLNIEYIAKRRKELKLSLQEMADCFGYKDAANYFKYEAGIYKFSADMLPKLAVKLKCKINDFFCT